MKKLIFYSPTTDTFHLFTEKFGIKLISMMIRHDFEMNTLMMYLGHL